MSVTATVSANEYEKTSQLSWAQFIATYFNNAVHTFGTPPVGYTFPAIDTFFRHQQIAQELARPKLIIDIAPGDVDRVNASTQGVRVRKNTAWRLYLTTASATHNWAQHDQVDALLGLILNGAREELAKSGLRIQRVGNPTPIADPKFQATQRNVWTSWQGVHGSAN